MVFVRAMRLGFVAAAAFPLVLPVSGDLDLVSLASADPSAVCSDGSPAGYYWKAGTSNVWIVDLQGGGWCTDEAECKKRCPPGNMESHALCSSKSWSQQKAAGGLMWPQNNLLLRDAHKAFIPYCTSDAHMGNAEAFGMQFRGEAVVRAVLREMVKKGLGVGPERHSLVFAGQSAGGRGAMVHLDYVYDMIGPTAGKNTDVFGLLDSPLYLDIAPYPGSGFKGFAAECQGVHSFANVTHLGKDCVAAHSNETWKCIMGQYRVPQIRTPYLLVAAEYDAYQLLRNKIMFSPDANQLEYASDFANRTASLMQSIRAQWPKNAAQQNAVYSRACHEHATSLSEAGFDKSVTISQTTMDEAMTAFLNGTGKLEWVDHCQGFACGGKDCKKFVMDLPSESYLPYAISDPLAPLEFGVALEYTSMMDHSVIKDVHHTPAGAQESTFDVTNASNIIYLIRHGEKDSHGCESSTGLKRAANLYEVFKDKFSLPASVFAYKYNGECQRCMQTVEPIAKKLGLSVDFNHGASDCKEGWGKCKKFAQAIESKSSSGPVLVASEHGHIKYIAYDLGVPQHEIPSWKGSDYDSVYVVTISGGKASLQHKYQTKNSDEIVV